MKRKAHGIGRMKMEKDITSSRNNALDSIYNYDDNKRSSFTDETGDYDYDCINTYGDHTSYDDEYYD